MAFDQRRTYLCYNNRDLIRDGFIKTFIEKEYIPVSSFNINRLKNPPKGVTYIVGRDSETQEIISVVERKKLLPAEKIKVEIDFSKLMRNAVTHPIGVAPVAPGAVGGLVSGFGNLGLSAIGFGGLTSGLTEMTFQIVESKTFINQRVSVTQEMLDTGIIQFSGFPLSVFGIVKEHVENFEEDDEAAQAYKVLHPQARISTNTAGDIVARIGLDFSADQIGVLGKFSNGVFSGSVRKRIDGATDSNGLFGGKANSELKLVENAGDSGLLDSEIEEREVVLLGDQKQLFIKIVDDDRTLKFRGDNHDAVGGGEYPFQISGTTGIDITDKQMRIDITDLVVGDDIYLTYNITVGERHLRQNIEHKGTIAQGNTIGVIGFVGAIGSDQDVYDYRIREWKVPDLPSGITMQNIDEVTDDYDEDDDYKLTLDQFITVDTAQRESTEELDLTGQASEIEGWRLSEAILYRRMNAPFFAADYRGILHFENRNSTPILLYPRSLIRDQQWFTSYLEGLDFTFPTGPVDINNPVNEDGSANLTYLPSDLEKKIEDKIDFKDMEGFLFDTSEIINSLFFDREKLHYYRPFSNALKIIGGYSSDDDTTGIGIPHLDLLPQLCPSIETIITTELIKGETITRRRYNYRNYDFSTCSINLNLEYYDLSYGVFDHVNAKPTKSWSCERPVDLRNFNYFSTNYDAMNDGPGAWLDTGFIENEIFEWRPEGGSLNSYWKLETPYYCSDFGTNSRVYVEKMGGNSLDNYSWIYVDTNSSFVSNISADSNINSNDSMVVFNDDIMHDSLCYYKFNDEFFNSQLPAIDIDKTKNHIRDTYEHTVDGQNVTEAYDHDKNIINGQNRILGDRPSYSYGIPITEEFSKICPNLCDAGSDISERFWWTRNLLTGTWDDGTSFGLDFSEEPPRANIPFNWYIRYVEVKFSLAGANLTEIEKYVSFYFEDTESSVSNIKISELVSDGGSIFTMRMYLGYYFGGPFQFLGKFWKEATIIDVNATFAHGNDGTLDPVFNVDEYKIESGQSAVVYDRQSRLLVFYANEETSNIDIAVSFDDGVVWFYDRNIIRLVSGETATLPYAIKDSNTRFVHLYYVLNDAFLMYKRIDTNWIDFENSSVEYIVPDSYIAGDYDLALEDPERAYWGSYTANGVKLRRETSYFVEGSADDQFFIDNQETVDAINEHNNSLVGTPNASKVQSNRFLFSGDSSDMREEFKALPYAIYLSDSGELRLFMISNGKLSIKRSSDYFTWQYDVFEQIIHKNYIKDELNKGFSEDISNIQIIRNDYDKSIVSVLYINSQMLFLRHFHTSLLFPWKDSEGNLQNQQMRKHLEIIDKDLSTDPPKERTKHVPIFLVGIIPDGIKDTLKNDIDNDVLPEESDLFIRFPYKDPDDPTDKDLNKAMVDRFNENFEIDVDTQTYGLTTRTGLIRIFYKDNFGNMDSIIVNSLTDPNLEVMNVFNGIN